MYFVLSKIKPKVFLVTSGYNGISSDQAFLIIRADAWEHAQAAGNKII